MKLVAVKAENFRSYKAALSLPTMAPVSVIIGPNNTGKSNLIELLTWYRGMMLGQGARSARELKHTGNRGSMMSVGLEFELDPEEKRALLPNTSYSNPQSETLLRQGRFLTGIRHAFSFGNGIESEEVDIKNQDGSWFPVLGWMPADDASKLWRVDLLTSIQRTDGSGNVAAAQRTEMSQLAGRPQLAGQWSLPGTYEATVHNVLRDFVQRWQLIPPVRQMTHRMDPTQEFVVQQGGSNLVRVLNTLQSEETAKFEEMMRDAYEIIPGLERITAPLRGSETTAVLRESGEVQVEARDFSTGLQQTLILVTSLLTYPKNSLIMIEEPEIHLHAGSQRALLRLIKRLTLNERHQFLITTHSTVFAEIGKEVSTYLVEKRNGTSAIRLLEEGSELKQLKQVLGHENTDLFGYNAVVVVEGDTEETAIPILAQAQGFDLGRHGVRIVNIRGKGKATRLEQLLRFLQDSDTIPFVMLDGAADVRKQVQDWIREGLVKPDDVFVWERDFEDCFADAVLIQAAQDLCRAENIDLAVAPEALATARRQGKTVFPVLERAAYETSGHGLSKPALGEKIAAMVGTGAGGDARSAPEDALLKIAARIIRHSQE